MLAFLTAVAAAAGMADDNRFNVDIKLDLLLLEDGKSPASGGGGAAAALESRVACA